VRRHHDLRGQAQAHRDRVRRVGDRRRAGGPLLPPGDEDPAEVLDQHRRAGRGRGPALSVAAGVAHLRAADPVLARLIDEHGEIDLVPAARRGRDHYGALVRAIVGQQLSVKAASTIHGRLLDLYGGRAPAPAEILATDVDALRAVGLSRGKAAYLRSLAEHVLAGTLELDRLDALPDDAVVAELTAVKGLGEWTAHMFLMFQLARPDVLPVGDQGIRNAVMRLYGLETHPSPAELERLAEPWRPWRTLACRYLWESLDNLPA